MIPCPRMADRCPACKQKVPPDATFCPRDGTPLEPTVAPKTVGYSDFGRETTEPGFTPKTEPPNLPQSSGELAAAQTPLSHPKVLDDSRTVLVSKSIRQSMESLADEQ